MAVLDALYPFPMDAIRGGQQVESGFAQAAREGEEFHRVMRDRLALRNAAKGIGQSNYFTGYEGVKGAERPQYIKDLLASGDPEQALALESHLSEPFKVQRGIDTAAAIEEGKRKAQLANTKEMFNHFMGDPRVGGVVNSMAGDQAPIPGGTSPMAEGREEPTAPPMAGGPPTANTFADKMSGRSKQFKITPQGPQFEIGDMAPVDVADKTSQIGNRADTLKLAKTKESREAEDQAHRHVKEINEAIANTQKAVQNRDVDPDEGQARLQELNEMRQAAIGERESLVRGRAPVPSSPAPGVAPPPQAAVGKPSASLAPPKPAGGLTYKEQGGLAVKDREEKMAASNKEIVTARLGAQKLNGFKRQVKELFDLVTKEDIGHPAMEGIPGAQNVLSLNRSNAQVKKLNEEITNMFAQPGQSQMMNTIVERQMQGAIVPGLFADPQLNKINAAILRSNMEHLSSFPTFLEKWHKNHKGSLDGATDAWIDYTENNPIYSHTKDARGRVTVKENKNVIPIDKWATMRANGQVRNVGKDVYIQGPDKSWRKK